MMATTHALVGLGVAIVAMLVSGTTPTSSMGEFLVLLGAVGGLLPDLDLYVGHRRTGHYPVLGAVAAGVAMALAFVIPSVWTLGVAVLVVAIALHPVMDIFGGGLELRPWRATSERAVYDHVRQTWIRPRRWIRYDGSPEDLGVAAVLAVPAIWFVPGVSRLLAIVALGISIAWVGSRRLVPRYTERVVAQLPAEFHEYLPDRFTSHS